VIGGGFGGLNAARELADADADVTLVDRTNHHLFQPLLYQVAAGILPPGLIAPALRHILTKQRNARVLLADVHDIDLDARLVRAREPDREALDLPYDTLVVAAGSTHSYFGKTEFAEYAPGVWVSPWPHEDLRSTVERAGGTLRTALAETFDVDPAGAWDLGSLAASYDEWTTAADRLVETELESHDDEDEAMFAARFHLVHEWRKFLFTDPGLPAALLPERWPGRVAEELFHDEATRLEPGATRFVVRCLAAG